jgi:hypothetical protein
MLSASSRFRVFADSRARCSLKTNSYEYPPAFIHRHNLRPFDRSDIRRMLPSIPVYFIRILEYLQKLLHAQSPRGALVRRKPGRRYYGAPPGWFGRKVNVQWDSMYVRLLDLLFGELLREHLGQKRGGHRIREARHNTRINCWRGLIRTAPTSAPSATPSNIVRQRMGSAALWTCSRWPKVRLLGLRPSMRRGAEVRRNRVPLRAAPSGAQPTSPSEPATDRSSYPRSDRVSRFYPTTNPIRGI